MLVIAQGMGQTRERVVAPVLVQLTFSSCHCNTAREGAAMHSTSQATPHGNTASMSTYPLIISTHHSIELFKADLTITIHVHHADHLINLLVNKLFQQLVKMR